MSRYSKVLSNKSGQYLLISSFPARMAYGMISLSIFFKVQQSTGSIAIAGLATGVNGITGATTAGLRGTLIDKFGMKIPLRVFAPSYAVLILLFSTGNSSTQLVVFAGVLGFSAPPINLSIRPLWKVTVPKDQIRTAYAIDTAVMNSVGVFGPLVATTVAATGRLSSTDPNLQNIPIRTEEGRKIRDCFTAQSPYLDLLTADYSQIEMRIMAHLSDDKGLISAFESGEDLHSTVASQVFGVKKNEVDAEMRRTIKAMSYGLAYGLSSFGLAQQLDIDPASASELMGKYFERFGGIRDYLKTVVEQARELGYTQTILGRRRYLPDLNHENRQRREIAERAALNAPIQGSAADIIKIAMLKVDSKIRSENLKSRLLLQVHDELILEVSPGEHEILSKIVKEQMSSAYELNVPLDVNIGVGKSWDLAAH